MASQSPLFSTSGGAVSRRSDWFISTSDKRRFGGAIIDAVQSLALFGIMLLLGDTLAPEGTSFIVGIAVVVGFLLLDVLLYSVPVSLFGWSIGHLITGRRVIDRDSGQHISLSNAARRYRARRVQVVVARFKQRFGAGGLTTIDATTSKADAAAGSAVVSASTPASAILATN